MTFIEMWVRTPISQAAGWTLFHFLWEGMIVAAVLAAALSVVHSSRNRYAAACLAMLVLVAGFSFTFVYQMSRLDARMPAASLVDLESVPNAASADRIQPDAFPYRIADVLPWTVPFWFAGVVVCYLRHLAGWIATRRWRRKGVSSAPPFWQKRLATLGARLSLSRPVTLLESCFAEVPVVIGHMRPVILLPIGLLAGLPTVQVESLLLHELAHIRRCDYLINLFQRCVEGLLFYHPAVWWISGVIREERENCCDDVVVAMNGDAREYAIALTTLEQTRSHGRQGAMAATGGSLVKRIRRILCPPESATTAFAPLLSTVLLMIAIVTGVAVLQSPPSHGAVVPATTLLPAITPQAPAVRTSPTPPPARTIPSAGSPQTADSFGRWLSEDIVYIIANEERDAFNSLGTDAERANFIEQFWRRRDPNPGTPENEFKEEHYRRIAYASERFGWRTDRGHIHIVFGRPDEKESHPARNGAVASELWLYRHIEGKGDNVLFEFADTTETGDFRLVTPTARNPQSIETIDQVQIRGNRRIPTETIMANLRTKPGSLFSPEVIARDVETLSSIGFFDDVRVNSESGPDGGRVLSFDVKETQ